MRTGQISIKQLGSSDRRAPGAPQAKKALPLSKVNQYIEPGPVVLLATSHKGRANVMTIRVSSALEKRRPDASRRAS
jgi:hypothetical protein